MLRNVALMFMIEFVEAGLGVWKLVIRFVGIDTYESSTQRQPVVEILDVGLLFLQQAELVSKPKGLNEFVLSSLLSLLERILVEGEKVIEVVDVEAFDLLV